MQRSRRTTTKWNLFFHYAYFVVAVFTGIVLVPFYLRHIAVDVYGAWLASGNILAWLTMIDPGLSTVLQQKVGVAYGSKKYNLLSGLVTAGFVLSFCVALIIVVAGLVSSHYLLTWLNLGSEIDGALIVKAFSWAAFGSALMVLSFGITSVNQGLQSSVGIGVIFMVATAAYIGTAIVLLHLGWGLLALPISVLARASILIIGNGVYLLVRFRQEKIPLHFDFSAVPSIMKLGMYTFAGRATGLVAANMDAFVLARYLGPETTAMFMLTKKPPDTSRMVIERPSTAVMPAISHVVGAGELQKARSAILQMMNFVLWGLGLMVAGFIALNKSFVTLWVGSALYVGSGVNAAVIMTVAATAFVAVLANICFALGNIKGNSLVSLAQGLVAIPLMYAGARYAGIIGVALAPLFAYMLTAFWYYPKVLRKLLSLQKAEVKVIFFEAAKVSISAIITILVVFLIPGKIQWLIFIGKAILLMTLYTVLVAALSKALREEMRRVLNLMRGKLNRTKINSI